MDMVKWNVYFIKAGEYLKIGISKDVKSRVAALQIGNPVKIELKGVIKNLSKATALNYEKKLHRFYENCRVCGEWFHRENFDGYIEEFETIIDGDGGFCLDGIVRD